MDGESGKEKDGLR